MSGFSGTLHVLTRRSNSPGPQADKVSSVYFGTRNGGVLAMDKTREATLTFRHVKETTLSASHCESKAERESERLDS